MPKVCFSRVLWGSPGGQQQFTTQTLRVHLLGIDVLSVQMPSLCLCNEMGPFQAIVDSYGQVWPPFGSFQASLGDFNTQMPWQQVSPHLRPAEVKALNGDAHEFCRGRSRPEGFSKTPSGNLVPDNLRDRFQAAIHYRFLSGTWETPRTTGYLAEILLELTW